LCWSFFWPILLVLNIDSSHSLSTRIKKVLKMPLLGKDHLSRGRGEVALLNKVLYTTADCIVMALSYSLIFTSLGPRIATTVFGSIVDDMLTEPIGSVRPFQGYLLMGGIVLYFAKVLYWNWCMSHSNTISIGAILLVGVGYYYFLAFSILLTVYVVNRMPEPWEIVVSVLVEPLSLLHELLVDWELTEFKRTKRRGELLDYGYHSACRHPNYFFNFFPLGAIGLMSGSKEIALMWVGIQIFWAYTQSGPGLEAYMATNYGDKWTIYCQRVPFVWPRPHRLWKILSFQYVGEKKKKILASGRLSMLNLDPKLLEEFRKGLAEEDQDD